MVRGRQRKSPAVTPKAVLGILLAAAVLFVTAICLNGRLYRVSFLPTMSRVLSYVVFSEYPHFKMDSGDVAVHFIDVGQGDSALIQSDNINVLIDCGDEEHADSLVSYIESRGIQKIDYIIATHPHSDHIGGMNKILDSLIVGEIIMPQLAEGMVPLSTSYEALLDNIEKKSIRIRYAVVGAQLRLGGGTYIDFLAPIHDDYDSLNNFSVIVKLTHGKNRFLFCADAERAAENDLLNTNSAIEADVIKIGHHGSTSSSTPAFLKKVSPKYAVISVGRNNVYGHPMPEVMERIEDVGALALTTAQYGHIVFVSDGGNLSFYTESGYEREIA